MPRMSSRHFATCTLCEAGCGIVVETEGDTVLAVRGDKDDPMSAGYVCPKVIAMKDLYEDPDRLRAPLVRDGGELREASWDEALDRAARGLADVRRRHGKDALAVYQGNPTAHNLGLLTIGQLVLRTLGTKNMYSASSTDQVPHMLAAFEMFGSPIFMPVSDVDRTQHMLVFGANPLVSNGSIMTAPDMRGRLERLRARGGRLVVVDPRRTETAEVADEHVFVRPGADAALLAAMLSTIFEERLARPGRLGPITDGLDELGRILRPFSPERVAAGTGVAPEVTRRLAREFAASPTAVCYGRIGVCHQEHASIASWLVYALNVVSGNLDRIGGAMFTKPAVDVDRVATMLGMKGYDRFRSRVRGLAETAGELPVATLADEIETEGPGQVRALLTSAGNPALSAPNGTRVERALEKLEFMVSIDGYLNETTRHAHVVLPPVSPLERSHYDVALNVYAVRNVAKYVPPVVARGEGSYDDAEILLELGLRLRLDGARPGVRALASVRKRLVSVGRRIGADGVLDLLLRTGPRGAGLLGLREGLTLARVRREVHGMDLGALEPRLPGILETPNQHIRLVPERFARELPKLEKDLAEWEKRDGQLVLIGRRHLRSNNSWLHNSHALVKGPVRCTLLMNGRDAEERGLSSASHVEVASIRGKVVVPLEISDELMRGVVSLPHGWGHSRAGVRMGIAAAHAGASVNDLTDERLLDRLTGNAALSGVPVTVARAAPP
jgi:anaerobic selenocysteine-containing dehydrogenase